MLSSPRLDNQSHCYTGLMALLEHSQQLEQDSGVSMLICFDHEEIGSESAQGAGKFKNNFNGLFRQKIMHFVANACINS